MQKSDRLKKLEHELKEQKTWLELGFVPKSKIEEYKNDIAEIEKKIEEEKERASRDSENDIQYIETRKSSNRASYENTSISDVEGVDSEYGSGSYEEDHDSGSLSDDFDTDDDPFSDKNRWGRKKDILDPESDDW